MRSLWCDAQNFQLYCVDSNTRVPRKLFKIVDINAYCSRLWIYCCSVAKSCLSLRNQMDYSTPGFTVLHCLQEFAQTHVHWADDALPPSHPLLPPSLPVLNLSWHQGLFQWVSLCIRWPKCWSFGFSISPSNEYLGLISLGWTGLISLQSKGLSRIFSNTTVQKHQFFGAQFSLWSKSHIHTWLLEKL